MKWNEAPHDLITSPPKRAAFLFAWSALMCALIYSMNEGSPRSPWFFPYAAVFCAGWAAMGYVTKPVQRDPLPAPRPILTAILHGSLAGVLVGVSTEILFVLGSTFPSSRWLA